MNLNLQIRGVVGQVYVDLITGFIKTVNAGNRTDTGINGKVNKTLIFFTRPTCIKKCT